MGDIVAVSGQPARGTWTVRATLTFQTPCAPVGFAIADVVRGGIADAIWEILKPDMQPVGTIMASGLAGGPPPPGAPRLQQAGNLAVTGGTGAYFGMRGR